MAGEDRWPPRCAGIFHRQFKFLTVRNLIMAWAVTACDFNDALLERWRGGIDRAAIQARQRLNMRQRRQQIACPAIRFSMARAIGRCRRATRRAERGPSLESINTLLLEESTSPFRSAGRRPAPASRPCYPFSLNTFNHKSIHQIMSNFSL